MSIDDQGLPRLVLGPAEDELDQLLQDAQGAFLQHPVAAQAAYTMLVAEGRRFAATSEGQSMLAELGRTPLARRLREAFEIASLHALDADSTGPYPSDFVDLLFSAMESGRPLLAGWRPQGSS